MLTETRTHSLSMSLGERERTLDFIEARGVTWEGAKENSDWQILYQYGGRSRRKFFFTQGK